MLPFGVTIPATVPQRSEIQEGLMNYPALFHSRPCYCLSFKSTHSLQSAVWSQKPSICGMWRPRIRTFRSRNLLFLSYKGDCSWKSARRISIWRWNTNQALCRLGRCWSLTLSHLRVTNKCVWWKCSRLELDKLTCLIFQSYSTPTRV